MPTSVLQAVAGLRVLLVLTALCGLAYPLAIWGVAQITVPGRANGSVVTFDGRPVGSRLVGQPFAGDEWFLPRPSVAGDGYDTLASGASNLGPENSELLATVERRRAEVAAREGVPPQAVPADAVTASASGLDPHISPAYADLQVRRVAAARGLDEQTVRDLVAHATTGRQLGVLGAPAVNVLELNLALERVPPRR